MGSKRPVGGGAMGSEVGNEMPQTLLRRFPAYCSIVPRHDPAYYFFGFRSVFHPCFIRVSSVAQGSLASVLSGTSVRSVAKEQARASVPHFLAKPKVRPLPTELQIGSLRSRNVRIEHQLAQTPERPRVGRRNRVARLHPARIPFRTTALIPVPPRTREHSRPSPAYGLRFDDKNS